MSTLDQWEAEAEDKKPEYNGYSHTYFLRDYKDKRILSLIDLIRKKDELIKSWVQQANDLCMPYIINDPDYLQTALELTEQLK